MRGRATPGGLAAGDEAGGLRGAVGAVGVGEATVGAGPVGHARHNLAATAVLVVLGPAAQFSLQIIFSGETVQTN